MGEIKLKSTGIVRQDDDIGRIVISKELRKTMDIKRKNPMVIFVKGNNIITQNIKKVVFFVEKWESFLSLKGLLFARIV